jgi:SpoVK/Ycf46/Vps4 family AAA+-type ATPase
MLPDLEDPGFVLTFVREMNHTNGAAPLVLVLEDADQVITERNMSNMSSISAVLNLSDGIVGKLLNLRILATSNTKVGASGFDSAALRKGRLTAHIKVGKLDASFANRVFQRLTGTEKAPFGRAETLADIYNGAKEFMTTVEKNV